MRVDASMMRRKIDKSLHSKEPDNFADFSYPEKRTKHDCGDCKLAVVLTNSWIPEGFAVPCWPGQSAATRPGTFAAQCPSAPWLGHTFTGRGLLKVLINGPCAQFERQDSKLKLQSKVHPS